MKVRFVAIILLLVICPATVTLAQEADKDDIKSSVLLNLFKHIEYPPNSPQARSDKLIVVFYGKSRVYQFFSKFNERNFIGGKRLETFTLNSLDKNVPLTGVHAIVVSADKRSELEALQEKLGNNAVLLYGDEVDGFLELGGMINLTIHQENVRPEVNKIALARVGIKISPDAERYAVRVIKP